MKTEVRRRQIPWKQGDPVSWRLAGPSGNLIRTASLCEGEEAWLLFPDDTWWSDPSSGLVIDEAGAARFVADVIMDAALAELSDGEVLGIHRALFGEVPS